jgi:uncharacterized protein (TIGR02246 family)
MQNDEHEIRQLVATWMAASKSGDIKTVMSLMTDDAVFLLPGHVMRKADYEAAGRAMAKAGAPKFDGKSDIQELRVFGEWAFMWSNLTVVMTPPDGAASVTRAGYTLTIFRKQNDKWLLARDANLLVPVP